MRLSVYEVSDGAIVFDIRTLFNGTDITHICYEADDKEGWAGVYIVTEMKNKSTSILADENGEPVSTTIKGKVEFILKPDAPEAARLEFERRKLGVIP